jgi:hypothetical protein
MVVDNGEQQAGPKSHLFTVFKSILQNKETIDKS